MGVVDGDAIVRFNTFGSACIPPPNEIMIVEEEVGIVVFQNNTVYEKGGGEISVHRGFPGPRVEVVNSLFSFAPAFNCSGDPTDEFAVIEFRHNLFGNAPVSNCVPDTVWGPGNIVGATEKETFCEPPCTESGKIRFTSPANGGGEGGVNIGAWEVGCDDPSPVDSSDPPVGPSAAFWIGEPAPNPSAGLVRLAVSDPTGAALRLEVFDATGRPVREIGWTRREGFVTWDGRAAGREVPSGVYFMRVSGAEGAARRKVQIVR